MFSSLLLVGCGKMGGALLEGWLRADILSREAVTIVTASESSAEILRETYAGVTVVTSPEALPRSFQPDALLFAVKPQRLADVFPTYADLVARSQPVILSVAAGVPMASFRKALPGARSVIRIMPNTPSLIGQGMSVLVAEKDTREDDRASAEQLCSAVGVSSWIAEESHMHAVTALSGSGPAYMFYFLESMIAAGVEAGLDEGKATELATQTMLGAASLAQRSDAPIAALRKMVTSPGGTTQAALDVLMGAHGISVPVKKAIEAAIARSKDLES